jgi:hypothetical protein
MQIAMDCLEQVPSAYTEAFFCVLSTFTSDHGITTHNRCPCGDRLAAMTQERSYGAS